MEKVIRYKELERVMNKTYETKNLSWLYRILNGEKEVSDLSEREFWYTQRLSGGMIGNPCERKIFYQYHQVAKASFSGRMYRLFDMGHVIEQMTLANLHACGIDVKSYDPKTSKQFRYSMYNDKYISKVDGISETGLLSVNVPVVFEIKSSNNKKFLEYVSKGIRKVNEGYYTQAQVAMDLSRFAKICVFIVVDKNTSAVYAEIIKYNKEFAHQKRKLAKKLITNPKIIPHKTRHFCNYCDFKKVCDGGIPDQRCRTCGKYEWKDNTCKITKEDCGFGDPCENYVLDGIYRTGLLG